MSTVARWFLANPRFLLLALGLIAVAGGSSYAVLPRMEDPLMRERAANVYTYFPGADAERIEALVTEKLEDSLREVDEIKQLRSFSRTGVSLMAIELLDSVTEPGPIWSRVRDKIDDVRPELPEGCSDPVFDQLDIKAYATLIAVTWKSDSPPSLTVLRRQAKQLEEVIKGVPGTENVDRFGDPEESIHVDVDPHRTAAMGLTVAEVASQVAASDAKNAAGRIRNDRSSVILQVDEEIDTLQRLSEIPIRHTSEGDFVPLGDLATIEKGITDPASTLALVDGRPSIVLGVMARSDVRIDRWQAQVAAAIDRFRGDLGTGLEVSWLYDQNRYVSDRMNQVVSNLVTGAAAVFVVVLLMMGLRSALVVSLALPLSALIVIAGLRAMGIPIHQMSITGLIIALGLLIDNAIIMVDSVTTRLREGESASDAIGSSLKHLALPLAGSTVTTALAFAPIALMPGPAGEFVGSIAISVMLAIFASLGLSLTIIPVVTVLLSRRSIERQAKGQPSRMKFDGIELPWLARRFERLLLGLLHRPWIGVAAGLALPLLGFIAAADLEEQFFPPADRDQIAIEIELPTGSSLERTTEFALAMRQRLVSEPRITAAHWFLGESAPTFYYNLIPRRKATPNYAQALVQLDSADDVRVLIRRLQDEFDREYPEARILVRQLEQGPAFDAPVELRLFGQDLEQLREVGEDLRAILAEIPDVIHTAAELSEVQAKLALSIDEEQLRRLELDHGGIASQLRAGLDGVPSGTILEGTEEIPVLVRVARGSRSDFDGVGDLEFVAARPPGAEATSDFPGIPLTRVATPRLTSDLAAINHYDGRRLNEVKAYLRAGVLPATVLEEFRRRFEAKGIRLPGGCELSYGGEAAERDQAVGNLMANVGVLGVLMVASLVLSFRSYRNAALIGVVGAMSLGVGLGSLWLFGFPFGFMSIVGSMGLVGVAINDSIVILAGFEEDPDAARGDIRAMVRVVLGASRHVLSTTLTTVAGFIPLVLAGGGFWPPLAVAISGGVGGATFLALLFVPAAYRLTNANRGRDGSVSGERVAEPIGSVG